MANTALLISDYGNIATYIAVEIAESFCIVQVQRALEFARQHRHSSKCNTSRDNSGRDLAIRICAIGCWQYPDAYHAGCEKLQKKKRYYKSDELHIADLMQSSDCDTCCPLYFPFCFFSQFLNTVADWYIRFNFLFWIYEMHSRELSLSSIQQRNTFVLLRSSSSGIQAADGWSVNNWHFKSGRTVHQSSMTQSLRDKNLTIRIARDWNYNSMTGPAAIFRSMTKRIRVIARVIKDQKLDGPDSR